MPQSNAEVFFPFKVYHHLTTRQFKLQQTV